VHVGIVSFTDVDSGIDLANALHEARVTVSLYLSQAHAATMTGQPERTVEQLYELGLLDSAVKTRLFQLRRMRDPGSFAVMREIARVMRADGVDLVHLLMGGGEIWTAVLACLLRDLPVASTMIIPKPNISEYPPARVVSAVNQLLAWGSDVIIVNGRDHVPLVQHRYHMPAERICYIALGPRSIFLRWATRQMPEDPGTILFLGRINPHKGLEYLVRAQPLISAQVPRARIVIAGWGADLQRCRGFIQDSRHFEIREGFIPGGEAADLFQSASLVAVPYISAATSGILMTAYVFGKPVVATRVGSLPEYVQDGVTGLLVPPADVKRLAEAISQLLADDALRHRMGENAARWIQEGELCWANLAAQTLAAYEHAIAVHYTRHRRTAARV
jgi:alpha-maltose-1-phosphate synthase